MNRTGKTFVIVVLCVFSYAVARAQGVPATILLVDLQNTVNYVDDVSDASKLATDPNVTTPLIAKNFNRRLVISDVVAVNGRPAKGTHLRDVRVVNLKTSPNPGEAIADTERNTILYGTFEILQADGTPIGSIMYQGLAGGPPAPGAPLLLTTENFAIVGGTGAFFGVRGEAGGTGTSSGSPSRGASMTEDPAKRRTNSSGGRLRFLLHLIPQSLPQTVVTSTGPAVVHANDSTPVTATKPAQAGEVLTLFAMGLGPTRPGVDPGQPFTVTPPQIVNSPVEVTVNGAPAEVLYAGGFPGSVDGYQLNFRLPSGTTAGQVSLQITAAFITGPEVKITVQ